MLLNVIYPDGSSGMIKSSTLDTLVRMGRIVAFHCSEGWVELRRKNESTYNGKDRRKTKR